MWVCFELEEKNRVLDLWDFATDLAMHRLDLSLILFVFILLQNLKGKFQYISDNPPASKELPALPLDHQTIQN